MNTHTRQHDKTLLFRRILKRTRYCHKYRIRNQAFLSSDDVSNIQKVRTRGARYYCMERLGQTQTGICPIEYPPSEPRGNLCRSLKQTWLIGGFSERFTAKDAESRSATLLRKEQWHPLISNPAAELAVVAGYDLDSTSVFYRWRIRSYLFRTPKSKLLNLDIRCEYSIAIIVDSFSYATSSTEEKCLMITRF